MIVVFDSHGSLIPINEINELTGQSKVMSARSEFRVVVVGVGAMGANMGRALIRSPLTKCVVGYDKDIEAVESFFLEAISSNKASTSANLSLAEAVKDGTNFVILSLLNEQQCEQVCFGEDHNLLRLMPKGSCVVLTSTVTGKAESTCCMTQMRRRIDGNQQVSS